MDTRRIDEADAGVSFDILKTWLSDAYGRYVAEAKPNGHGWQALTLALHRAAREQGDGAQSMGITPEFTEQELRLRIVSAYRQQEPSVTEQVIQAKIDDPWSFFCRMGYRDLKDAKQQWEWYLWCLTCQAGDFQEFAQSHQRESMACIDMPLDSVDLQVVAVTFRTQIIVSRLMEAAMVVHSSQGARACAHLLMHRGFWAPVLGTRALETELREIVGAVVQLGEFSAQNLQPYNNQLASVVRFDKDNECFVVCVDDVMIPVERSNIRRVVFQERTDNSGSARFEYNSVAEDVKPPDDPERKPPDSVNEIKPAFAKGEGPELRGIPDNALEFQILQEQVRRLARARLDEMKQELAGRTSLTHSGCSEPSRPTRSEVLRSNMKYEPVPKPSRNEAMRQQQQKDRDGLEADALMQRQNVVRAPPNRLPFEEALARIKAETSFSIVAPCKNVAQEQHGLNVDLDEELWPTHEADRGERDSWLCCTKEQDGPRGWIPKDRLVIYMVGKAWQPDKAWEAQAKYLALNVGDCIIVKSRYGNDWHGWCFGERWGVKEGQSEWKKEGVLHTSFLCNPFFLSRN